MYSSKCSAETFGKGMGGVGNVLPASNSFSQAAVEAPVVSSSMTSATYSTKSESKMLFPCSRGFTSTDVRLKFKFSASGLSDAA